MNTSVVTSIRVKYADGSVDEIEPLQGCDTCLFGLCRQRPGALVSQGAYMAESIAALLFATSATATWTDYSLQDPKIAALVQSWNTTQ